jgi:vancomycin resistance protein VanW
VPKTKKIHEHTHSIKEPFSDQHPALFWVRLLQRRIVRRIAGVFWGKEWAFEKQAEPLDFRVMRHQSKLLPPQTRPAFMVASKVHNVKLAACVLNHRLIKPGETLSFWHALGYPSHKKGYRAGPELRRDQIVEGMGGGLCQLASLIHWMSLHSDLVVTERHSHSVDLYPDEGRALPYGCDAAVFYNFKDLMIFNPTDATFQFNFEVSDKHLKGELRSTVRSHVRYHVYEKGTVFLKAGERHFRRNQIWRDTHTKGHHPLLLKSELLYVNFVKTLHGAHNPIEI